MSTSPDPQPPPGVVELREDVPLKAGPGAGGAASAACAAGPRLILAAFAALSAAITLALLTQIYYGDYEVVPHGSVAASGAECSSAGTGVLRAGGRALDAAAAAALCLAVVAPHRTSLDASGALLYWEYRSSRTTLPTLVEWGGPVEAPAGPAGEATRPPRLLAALAALHAKYGALPWPQLLQPAIDIARAGFPVSEGLAAAAAARALPGYLRGALRTEPALADYLETLKLNSSAQLCAAWGCTASVRESAAESVQAGAWRVWAGGAGGRAAAAALARAFAGLEPDLPYTTVDAQIRVVTALQQQVTTTASVPTGVASGLAVVDPLDTYAALVTGLSTAFGSEGPAGAAGWARDAPLAPLDLAPALLLDGPVCGTRYVLGAESAAALAQSATAAMTGETPAEAAEVARLSLELGALALEATRPVPALAALAARNGSAPYAAVNLVQQVGDALLSHADSRGGGIASRFK